VDFDFKLNGDYFLSKPESLGLDLKVKDKHNIPQKLIIVDPSIGMETLGVYISLNRSSEY